MKGLKAYKVVYYIGVSLSLSVGLWHFFVPLMFKWYSYIPGEYRNLVVGIDWTNLCFSFLLCGVSLLLLFWGKKVFAMNVEAITVYCFLVLTWLFRVLLSVCEPWPLQPIPAAAIGQFVAAIVLFLILLIPCVRVIVAYKKRKGDIPIEKSE